MVEDELLARETAHLRHHRDRQSQSSAAGSKVALPAAPHDRVAAIHQKAGAGVGSLEEVAAGSVVEVGQKPLAAAADHVIDQGAVAVRGHARSQDFDIGRSFDQSLCIAWRPVDIDDDAVACVTRRNCNGGARYNAVIGADRAEGTTLEGRRLKPEYFKF